MGADPSQKCRIVDAWKVKNGKEKLFCHSNWIISTIIEIVEKKDWECNVGWWIIPAFNKDINVNEKKIHMCQQKHNHSTRFLIKTFYYCCEEKKIKKLWNNNKINCVESHSIQFSSTLASSLRSWVSEKEWWNYHKYTTKLSKGSNNVMIWRKKKTINEMYSLWTQWSMILLINCHESTDFLGHIEWFDEVLSLCLHFTSWIKSHSSLWKDYQLKVSFW